MSRKDVDVHVVEAARALSDFNVFRAVEIMLSGTVSPQGGADVSIILGKCKLATRDAMERYEKARQKAGIASVADRSP